MIIKSQIWVAKYFTQGKCEEAVSEEKNLLSRTHRTSSQEDADNQYCFTAKALRGTYSGKWINPNHPFKCSQILQMVRVEVDMFWGAIHFFCTHWLIVPSLCRVWDIPAHSLLAFRRWVWPLQGGFISPGVRGPQDKCLYWSESLKCVSGEKLQWFVWPILGKRLQMRAIACWRCPFLSIDGKWDLSAWCRCRDLGAIRWDGSYPQ